MARHSPHDGSESWQRPLFESLLRGVRLKNSAFFRTEYRAPWGVRVSEPGLVFHVVASGEGWLQTPDAPRLTHLSAGDYVVLTRGKPHTLRDSPATPVIDWRTLRKRPRGPDGIICSGGDGAATSLVTGSMELEDSATDPLLAVLPPVLHVKPAADERERVQPTVERVCAELRSRNPGATEVVARIADLVLIQAVRDYFATAEHAWGGWLAAVGDAQIGRAISLLHLHPGAPWTVASLARRVALSRSAFAERFRELVREPPVRYLTRLRLNGAARRLRSSNDKLTTVAAEAGYESVAAFIRAFRRHVGLTPREYRARSRVLE